MISYPPIMETKVDDMIISDNDDIDNKSYYELYVDSVNAAKSGGNFDKDEDGNIKTTINIVGGNIAELIEGKNKLSLKLKLLKVSASYDKSNDFKYETLGTTNVELEIPKQLSKTKNIEKNKQIDDGDLNLNIDKLRVSPILHLLSQVFHI